MALAVRELRSLIGRVDNDNVLPLRDPVRELAERRPSPGRGRLALDYETLSTRLEAEAGILWAWMRHPERACFTPALMADGRHFQELLRAELGECAPQEMPFRYLVWGSRAAGAWSMGGDLGTFTRLIRSHDEAGLRAYAYRSIDVLYDNYRGGDLPILTAALIQGDAVGGGFEAMLTNDLVVAERGAKFGLPEILFNLFPGMGAYSFLRRKVGERLARTLIEDGRTRSADELKELGLVDLVCDAGQGEAVLRAELKERDARFRTELTLKRVRHRSDPLAKAELIDIVELWVERALELGENELRRMDCLARHQERRRAAAAA